MRAVSTMIFCFVLILFMPILVFAQVGKPITHVQTRNEERLEFRSSDNRLIKAIDVVQNNRYAKLGYKSTQAGTIIKYTLAQADKSSVLNYFFPRVPKDILQKLDPANLKTNSDVLISESYVVIADHLTMGNREGGVLGVKSVVTVYDDKGNKIASLPENNDGYFSPVVTKNGKYLATNYGDVSSHVDFTLLPSPGFRIYDLKGGNRLYEVQSTTEFDVLPPSVQNDMIFGVLRFPNNRYEYQVFFPEKGIVYKKIFTGQEVDNFVRFHSMGFVVKEGGKEVTLEYEREFLKSGF